MAMLRKSEINRDVERQAVPIDSIYREHADWLRQIASRRLRMQPADADDVVQDAYLRIAQRVDRKIESPRGLLAQIATNLFRDAKRRQAVRDGHRMAAREADPVFDTRSLCEQEAVAELERLILALPEPLRDVFVLSRFRHMTNRDIANHLGVSIKTVEWRMSRALDFCVGRLRD